MGTTSNGLGQESLFNDLATTSSELELNFRCTDKLLSAREATVYKTIVKAIPEATLLMSKVKCSDILLPSGKNQFEDYAMQRSIGWMHFDYVLIDANSFCPLLAIELQDRSHKTKAGQLRDAKKSKACETAGFPLIRIYKSEHLTEAKMHSKLLAVLETRWQQAS
jgi:very-short-patch-repair endonuclease